MCDSKTNFSQDSVRSLTSFVKYCVNKSLQNNTLDNNPALITSIHPDVNIKYNSVNVIVGKQSSGKTVIALEEIIKISLLHTHHLLLYITKEGKECDKTWITLKSLIQMPYEIIAEKNIVERVDELIKAKSLYYKIRDENLEDSIIEEQKTQLLNNLHVEDFHRETLHTLILFDDISNNKLFNDETSYFSQLIRRCRHTNISYFLLIQGWKGLKPHIKNEITTLFIFPCFNKQQLHFIYSQSASNLTFDEFYNFYREMVKYKNNYPDSHPYMIIEVSDGGETKINLN